MAESYLTPEEQERRRLLAEQDAPSDAVLTSDPSTAASGAPGSVGGYQQSTGAPGSAQASATTSGTTPQPPPAPPGLDDLTRQVGDFASDWMGQGGNRYTTDLANATRAESVARLANDRANAERWLEEYNASRGLTGSNLEQEGMIRMGGELDRSARSDERDLLRMMVEADAADRMATGEFGLNAVNTIDEQGLARYLAGLEGQELMGTMGIAQQNINLRAQELVQQAEFEGRRLDIAEAQNIAQTELQWGELGISQQDVDNRARQIANDYEQRGVEISNAQINTEAMQQLTREAQGESARQFDVTAGLTQQGIEQRAQQIMNEGRALDLQEARDIASQELGQAGLAQRGEQFTADLAQRQAEFASTIGLSREQFEAQTAQFTQQYGEQVASRLQQNEQFRTALASDEARNALDVGLRERALSLQQTGMEADQAYREASLIQERELTTRAQDLEAQGMGLDNAYRYAALEQDGTFRAEALRLEETGLNMEDSYRQADQQLQLRQLGIQQQQVDQRAEEIRQGDRSLDIMSARDRVSADLAREEMQYRMDLQTNEIAQRESEFARSMGFDERRFNVEQAQFGEQMAEQVASRLQQDAQFQATWEQEDSRMAIENGLRTRALDLQQQGMNADIAFQQAQQEFEYGYTDANGVEHSGYRDRTLELQRYGIDEDSAYRYAALEKDTWFRQEAQRLQEEGMGLDEAYRRAELMFRESTLTEQQRQFNADMMFRESQASDDKDRFNQMMAMYKEWFGDGDFNDTTVNVYTGGTGGTGGDEYNPFVNPVNPPSGAIPRPDGDWAWDQYRGTWVDRDGNEYNE